MFSGRVYRGEPEAQPWASAQRGMFRLARSRLRRKSGLRERFIVIAIDEHGAHPAAWAQSMSRQRSPIKSCAQIDVHRAQRAAAFPVWVFGNRTVAPKPFARVITNFDAVNRGSACLQMLMNGLDDFLVLGSAADVGLIGGDDEKESSVTSSFLHASVTPGYIRQLFQGRWRIGAPLADHRPFQDAVPVEKYRPPN